MKNRLEGTMTEQNIMRAFALESQARNKYTFFASVAKKEGYEQIAEVFEKTAANEKEHAEIWFKKLDMLGTTATNLMHAAAAENEEWSEMYRDMARIAEAEEFYDIAELMRGIADIEHSHEQNFRKYLHELERHQVFKCETSCIWVCRNCGHIHVGDKAPDECPICNHSQAYFEKKEDIRR